jgi:hypothetical protein
MSEASTSINTPQELERYIVNELYNRKMIIEFNYKGSAEGLDSYLNNALSKEPYLNHSIDKWDWSYGGIENNLNIIINVDHLLSKAEEDKVSNKVDEILNRILTDNMSVHQKAKVIHDYIVLNTEYDTDYNYYSHYDALFKNKAVCNGYALLAYKMYKQAGFKVGFVKGYSNDELHLWNTIDMNGHTYHIDLTWNDPVPNLDYPVYDYYMLRDDEISIDHKFNGSYSSDTPYHRLLNIDISSNLEAHNSLIDIMSEINLKDNYQPINISLNNRLIKLDQPPIIQNGRTLVPVRAIFEGLNMNVTWNPKTLEVKGFDDFYDISMTIAEKKAYVNNVEYILDSPPKILNGRTLVPVRFISESIGKTVSWNSKTRTVVIK